jgi:hypothetical protein
MKVRVYYDGYNDVYRPQYKWCGFWRSFIEFGITPYGCGPILKTHRATKEEAIAYLNKKKAQRKAERESEAAAKERSKKSGVVYEDVI